ncbi:uncharacterized protein Z519_10082 [Cladophialophora bantiana CBS 173.52]|uniref:Uncharacterized protein n=1 Tax=Cladophialophora bantiana (strain ATCC 10958 / CBS 173.52 / CDC B-1940 / NIH 8579) TaxID=1442370 RepID=A0A0D2HX92_CLAB1|nr:uncharacterized protein Z519_10082 [Cladophialophora bantiana CBS 173.52]KIW89229.1 hypothetical protein Z519_10082 [Cladophialophora bantiana CBS 173.52]
MSLIGSSVAESGVCISDERSNVHLDAVLQANDRVSLDPRLQTLVSADSVLRQEDRIDNAIQDTKDGSAAAIKLPEPALESVGVRPKWYPDSSVLQRLKWSTKNLSETTAHSQQLSLISRPLNDAMETLSPCEERKSPTPELSFELSDFLNRRRRPATDHDRHCLGGPPSCRANDNQRGVHSGSGQAAEPLLQVRPSERPRTMETGTVQLCKRDSLVTINNGYASHTDYLQRVGRALDCEAAARKALIDLHKDLDCRLSLEVEAAEIWRRNTETALATTQNCIYREQSANGEEEHQSIINNGKYRETSSISTEVSSDNQPAVSTDECPVPQRQEIDALRLELMSMRVTHTVSSLSSPLAHPSPALNHLPYKVPRRKPLPTMASFSSSQSTVGALSSANDWNSSGTEEGHFTHYPRTQSSFQDADKHVVPPAEETVRPMARHDTSAPNPSFEQYSTSKGSASTVSVAIVSAPTYYMTRGRTWLERRAQDQG